MNSIALPESLPDGQNVHPFQNSSTDPAAHQTINAVQLCAALRLQPGTQPFDTTSMGIFIDKSAMVDRRQPGVSKAYLGRVPTDWFRVTQKNLLLGLAAS